MNHDNYKSDIDDMPGECTREMLGKGVRGKYYAECMKGPNTVTVHYSDETFKTKIVDSDPPLQKRLDDGK